MAASEAPFPPRLKRLIPFPSGDEADVDVRRLVDDVASWLEAERPAAPGARPRTLLNMASTADGRASIEGRSGPIGDRADTEMLHGLRTIADALLVGAGTARAERYARVLRGAEDRQARLSRGLAEEPLICIASAKLDISPLTVPLLDEPQARIVLLTPSSQEISPCAASVGYIRRKRDGVLDLPAALSELRARYGVQTLLCEGGPTLAADLLGAGLADELFLSLAPKLAGGGPALRILAGVDLDPPVALDLLSLHEHESTLFLRYRVRAGGDGR